MYPVNTLQATKYGWSNFMHSLGLRDPMYELEVFACSLGSTKTRLPVQGS